MESGYLRYVLYGTAGVAAFLWLKKSATKSNQASTDFDSFLKAPVAVDKPTKHAATSFAAFLHVQPEEPCSTDFASFLKDRTTGAQPTTPQDAASEHSADQIPEDAVPVVVLYGTEYGFAREIAEKLCQQLKDTGKCWPCLVNSADHASGYDLAQQQAAFMIFSTQGDGVPPSESRDFCEWLFAGKAGPLPELHYSVCALGDTTYTHFCRCGKQVDAALASAGALQLLPRVDVDKEDWVKVDAWIAGVVSGLTSISNLKTFADLGGVPAAAGGDPATTQNSNSTKKYSKSKPYYARVVAVEGLCVLSTPDDKDTIRLELELSSEAVEAGGLSYLPGDALGIWPTNPPQVVDDLIQQLGASGDERVQRPSWHYTEDPTHSPEAAVSSSDNTISLRHALSVCYDIKTPKAQQLLQVMLQQMQQQKGIKPGGRVSIDIRADAAITGFDGAVVSDTVAAHDSSSSGPDKQSAQLSAAVARIQAILADNSVLEPYLAARHVTDILQDFPAAAVSLDQLVSVLRPLQPRLYSISSSPLEHNPVNSGVQATIAVVRYESLGKARQGVCSTQVGERLEPGMHLPIFISKNPDFRLPADPSKPIIMVGPGTGLAPFRAFILQRLLQQQQQRDEGNPAAPGPMHLFFGCRRRDQDFLYGQQLQQWHDNGVITLHTAFSRETSKKVYVQQRLREAADVVWELLESGGHFYVCGDAGSMAGAVEAALLEVIEQHQQSGTNETARKYLDQLAAGGRYERDVWF